MEQAQEQSEAQSQSFCGYAGETRQRFSRPAGVQQPSARPRSYLLLPQVPHPTDQRQVEADSEAVLEEKRRPAAVQLPFGDDGDAIAEEVGFIHVMGGQNHCPTCNRVQKALRRLQTFCPSSSSGGGGGNSMQECSVPLTHRLCISAAGPKWPSWNMGPLPTWARPK